MSRLRASGCIVLWIVTLGACGGDTAGPPNVTPTASLSGVVREGPGAIPVAGASVTAGSVSATSGADGRFLIANAPLGSAVMVRVSAPGFDTYSQTIAVLSGQNTHDVTLARKTLYELQGKTFYLPPGVATYRGVIFDLPGSTADSRPLVRGDLAIYQAFPLYGNVTEYRRYLLEFAAAQQFAIMGTSTFTSSSNVPATYDEILASLVAVAAQSAHPELAHAPMFLFGHSLGGCIGYGFTRLHADRVIGFISGKGACHEQMDGLGAKSVPAYLLIGEEDSEASTTNITRLFEANRAEGAPWVVAVEPGADHTRMSDFELQFNWITQVVARRLPASITPGQPVQLRPVETSTGWLGDVNSHAIARDECYTGDKLKASWLPSETTARDWQSLVSGSTVVIGCP